MSRRIARPYAAALYAVIEREGGSALRRAEAELEAMAEVFRREPSLLKAFEVPSIPLAQKKELIATVTGALDLRAETARLVLLMTEHLRLRLLPDVLSVLGEMVDRREGLQRGTVQVPAPLDPAQVTALAAAMGGFVGARVELAAEVRPELLAGFVVRIGSRVWDGSLDAQLRRFAAGADHT
ncbi:MAG: ATP synthase F1 subunit delta [Thermoanaerobaculaceae bacterium]|nr:ATP synthase F1 subunit delta [Thermoanaerobaculaceae bacterium]MDI9621354.1 ATP synthase F1 subunit delta [Acidobacteriota bacterium]NLH11719.1 ATP synthase F1 subunit delta [Holophagae bacterium]HPW54114.1 ATP synthase F1 subunit delta [Thermoanaerobaculaceae bacterium]